MVGGKVYVDGGFVEAGISIDDGRVARVAKEPHLPEASGRLNVDGLLVLPGFVDVHVHLRGMELSYKEDFYTGTCAAAAGGFTTVLDMPNTKPPTNSPERLREKITRARGRVVVRVGFYGALPKPPSRIPEMVEAGAVAFKVYLHHPITELDISRDEVLLDALSWVAEADVPAAIHAEDAGVIEDVKRRLGPSTSPMDFAEAHPIEAEVRALRRVIPIAQKAGAKIHICHVSSTVGVQLIRKARASWGTPITCEATPHHLLLTVEDLEKWGSKAMTDPPLRPRAVAQGLLEALKLGWIDVVASDHAPHTAEEKGRRDVWAVPPGIPGLETTAPLMLNLVNKGVLTWRTLIQRLSSGPSRIFGLSGGEIRDGAPADLVVVDAKCEHRIDSSKFHSKAHYSPFDGWVVRGKPVVTIVGGRVVMRDGEITAPGGAGKIIRLRAKNQK